MKPRSAKNKGNRFENYLVEAFKELDPKAHRTYGSGSGLDKNDVRLPNFNIEIEAKNQEKIHLIKDWEQLRVQTLGANLGVLAIRNPRKPEFEEVLCVIELNDFIQLCDKRARGGRSKKIEHQTRNKGREASYAFSKAREALRVAGKFLDEL